MIETSVILIQKVWRGYRSRKHNRDLIKTVKGRSRHRHRTLKLIDMLLEDSEKTYDSTVVWNNAQINHSNHNVVIKKSRNRQAIQQSTAAECSYLKKLRNTRQQKENQYIIASETYEHLTGVNIITEWCPSMPKHPHNGPRSTLVQRYVESYYKKTCREQSNTKLSLPGLLDLPKAVNSLRSFSNAILDNEERTFEILISDLQSKFIKYLSQKGNDLLQGGRKGRVAFKREQHQQKVIERYSLLPRYNKRKQKPLHLSMFEDQLWKRKQQHNRDKHPTDSEWVQNMISREWSCRADVWRREGFQWEYNLKYHNNQLSGEIGQVVELETTLRNDIIREEILSFDLLEDTLLSQNTKFLPSDSDILPSGHFSTGLTHSWLEFNIFVSSKGLFPHATVSPEVAPVVAFLASVVAAFVCRRCRTNFLKPSTYRSIELPMTSIQSKNVLPPCLDMFLIDDDLI